MGGWVKTLSLGTGLIAILTISALLNPKSGLQIWSELREDLSGSAARVAQLSQENEEMRNEILMLESEPSALDRAIREELDMVLPGEIVVRFTRSKSSETQPPATAGQGWWLARLFGRDGSDRKSK